MINAVLSTLIVQSPCIVVVLEKGRGVRGGNRVANSWQMISGENFFYLATKFGRKHYPFIEAVLQNSNKKVEFIIVLKSLLLLLMKVFIGVTHFTLFG
jgi:hypothetical protein